MKTLIFVRLKFLMTSFLVIYREMSYLGYCGNSVFTVTVSNIGLYTLPVLVVTRYCNKLLFRVTSNMTSYFHKKVTSNSNALLFQVTSNENVHYVFVTFFCALHARRVIAYTALFVFIVRLSP